MLLVLNCCVYLIMYVILLLYIVSGEVNLLPSSLTATGRRHSCAGEPLLFTCEVNGTYLDWKFDTVHRTIFFSDQSVDEVQTVPGQGFKLRSILTDNEALTGTTVKRRLASTLIIQLSEPNRDSHNITCSSDTEIQVVRFQTAGKYILPLHE